MSTHNLPAAPSSVMDVFESTGAYLKGHFRLTSGLHSQEYLQCAKVLQYPRFAEQLGREMAAKFRAMDPAAISVVVAPAMGGLIIGHEVARALGVRFVFTERDPGTGKMTLRRGFELFAQEQAVVVEDVITTGGSTREVIEILQAAGVMVLSVGSIIDRSAGRADVGVPRAALATLSVTTWSPELCPLCRQGSVAVKPGSRNAA